jgi:hypothetical protein
MTPYPSEIEQQMQRLYSSLNEKDRRRYAGIESVKLGWGGMSYISHLFNCDYYTHRSRKKKVIQKFQQRDQSLTLS